MKPTTYRAEAIVITTMGERQAMTRYLTAYPSQATLSPYIATLVDLRIVLYAPGTVAKQRTLRPWTLSTSQSEFVKLMTEHH